MAEGHSPKGRNWTQTQLCATHIGNFFAPLTFSIERCPSIVHWQGLRFMDDE